MIRTLSVCLSLTRQPQVRKSFRRKSITFDDPWQPVAASDALPSTGSADSNNSSLPALVHQAGNSGDLRQPSFIGASRFPDIFSKHAQSIASKGWDQATERQHRNKPYVSAVAEVQTTDRLRREMFEQQPKVRLQKSDALYAKEMRMARKSMENKTAGDEPANEEDKLSKSAAPSISKFVEVPLFPPEYLKRRAMVADGLKPYDSMLDDQVERLQGAATRNHLASSGEHQPFRCLNCFHVFEARPCDVLKDVVDQRRFEADKIEDNRRHATFLSHAHRQRKSVFSRGKMEARYRDNPDCCPKCRSKRLQWMMEYAHTKAHHKSPL